MKSTSTLLPVILLLYTACVHSCPLITINGSWIHGLTASEYKLSSSDIGSILNGSVMLGDFEFLSQETVDEILAGGNISVFIFCAEVPSAGCDGNDPEGTFLGNWGNESQCLGCSGDVEVEITGEGEFNTTLGNSTCPNCVCDAAGTPYVDGIAAMGKWNSSGNCSESNYYGSCNCSLWDGSVITPDGPWESYGNCTSQLGDPNRTCSVNLTGWVYTPPTVYNVSGNCSGCNCSAGGVPYTPPTTWNVTGTCLGNVSADRQCSCSQVDGSVYTPKTLYHASGLCGSGSRNGACNCSASGEVLSPAVLYNATGNCSTCSCSANGTASVLPPYIAQGSCSGCSCLDNGTLVGANCSNCTCAPRSYIPYSPAMVPYPNDCSACACSANGTMLGGSGTDCTRCQCRGSVYYNASKIAESCSACTCNTTGYLNAASGASVSANCTNCECAATTLYTNVSSAKVNCTTSCGCNQTDGGVLPVNGTNCSLCSCVNTSSTGWVYASVSTAGCDTCACDANGTIAQDSCTGCECVTTETTYAAQLIAHTCDVCGCDSLGNIYNLSGSNLSTCADRCTCAPSTAYYPETVPETCEQCACHANGSVYSLNGTSCANCECLAETPPECECGCDPDPPISYRPLGNCSSGCTCSANGTLGNCSDANCACYAYAYTPSSDNCNGCECTTQGFANASTPGADCSTCQCNEAASCGCECEAESCDCGCDAHICDCSCPANVCGCHARQLPCDCGCDKTCHCGCVRNPCGFETSDDGKTFTATGGNTCQVRAKCVRPSTNTSAGFYDGRLYRQYASGVNVTMIRAMTNLGYVYLIGSKGTNAGNGQYTFPNLKVTGAATLLNPYTFQFSAADVLYNTTVSSAVVMPKSIKVVQTGTATETTTANEYTVATMEADIGNYSVQLWGDTQITLVNETDGFNVGVELFTGEQSGAQDSSTNNAFTWDVTSDLVVRSQVDGAYSGSNVTVDSTSTARFWLSTQNQAGEYFRFKFTLFEPVTDLVAYLGYGSPGSFRITPAAFVLGFGSPYTAFAWYNEPRVVTVDGANNDSATLTAFPNEVFVNITAGDSTTLASANCKNCMIARLLKCSDSAPSATDSSTSYSYVYPECQTAAQALCATSNAAETVCTDSSTTNNGEFLNTLSGTTKVDVVNGMATLSSLAVHYVFGAGYKLQFTLAPSDNTAYSVSSVHSNGQVELPQVNMSSNNTFFVLPHNISMTTSPGGDGIDLGANDGDLVTGTGDGVGLGLQFRNQPAITVHGDGYAFNKNWGTHGHAPLTAIIKGDACFNVGCAGDGLALSGNSTPVAQEFMTAAAIDSLSCPYNATFSGSPTTTNPGVEAKYDSSLAMVGFQWTDLYVTKDTATLGQADVVLSVLLGVDTHMPCKAGTMYRFVDSTNFDVFVNPEAPTNLQVFSYGSLGFRLEFQASRVLRSRPVAGFIVEVDVCNQTLAACATTNYTKLHLAAYGVGVTSALASDFHNAGGRVEAVMASYSTMQSGAASTITLKFVPSRELTGGDQIKVRLGAKIAVEHYTSTACSSVNGSNTSVCLDMSTFSCTASGPDGSKFGVTINPTGPVASLDLNSGEYLPRGVPVEVSLDSDCNVTIAAEDALDVASSTDVLMNLTGIPEGIRTVIYAPVESSSNTSDSCPGGCTVSKTYTLPTIQDSSSVDLEWAGGLKYGYNVAQSRAGTSFTDSDAACRSGSGTKNPCALTIGSDWTVPATLTFSGSGSAMEATSVSVDITRDRAFVAGDVITIPVTGATNVMGSFNFTANGTAMPYGVSKMYSFIGGWNEGAAQLTLQTLETIPPNTMVTVTAGGFNLSTTTGFPTAPVTAEVYHEGKMTLVFKNGALQATYGENNGDPLGLYTQTGTFPITLGKIYKFRVYAYNGKFLSEGVESVVHNRAITTPNAPAYFPALTHINISVALAYSPELTGQTTELALTFTPTYKLLEGHLISIPLAGFSGQTYTEFCDNCTAKITTTSFGSTPHAQISSGRWWQNTSTLVLEVASGATIAAYERVQLYISNNSMILYPGVTNVPLMSDGTSGVWGWLSTVRLNWVTDHPTATKPRLGFMVQMSSDPSWQSDVQTIMVPDEMDVPAMDTYTLPYALVSDMVISSSTVTISGTPSWLVGSSILVESELMEVTAVSADTLTVERGIKNTTVAPHAAVLGPSYCGCQPNGTVIGNASCACNVIKLAFFGATDDVIATSGLDSLAGLGCFLGRTYHGSGCNPYNYIYESGVRSHQSLVINSLTSKSTRFLGACSSSSATVCSSSCECDTTTKLSGLEFGNVQQAGIINLTSPWDPLRFPTTSATTLLNDTTTADTEFAVGSVTGLLNTYIRIDDELMYVTGTATRSKVLTVQRGAFGTTAAVHAIDTAVLLVPWPSVMVQGAPSRQYYFRIAAYNRAGISDYLYYTMEAIDITPRSLPAFGGIVVELSAAGLGTGLEPTGSGAFGFQVLIGHLNEAGDAVDFPRTRECLQLLNLDQAGTRLQCESPPWVGLSHSFITYYQSGMFQRFAQGTATLKFSAPRITLIQPNIVQGATGNNAPPPATITIFGENFGINQSDVSGVFQTASANIPCTNLRLNGAQVICTLVAKRGQSLIGTVVLTVGTAWSGGGQTTKASNPAAAIVEVPPPAEVAITIAQDITTIPPGSPERTTFVNSFTNDVAQAAGVPQSRINVTSITAGSVIVNFVILPDPNNAAAPPPADLANSIISQAADPTSALLTGSVTSLTTAVTPISVITTTTTSTSSTSSAAATPRQAYLTNCSPKQYSSLDMSLCYDCCSYSCQTGTDVPTWEGVEVLQQDRWSMCQLICMHHCGYARPINSLTGQPEDPATCK